MFAVFLPWGRKIATVEDLTEAQRLATIQKPALAYVMDLRNPVELVFKNWEGSYGQSQPRQSTIAV
jgi:hypothetical protein